MNLDKMGEICDMIEDLIFPVAEQPDNVDSLRAHWKALKEAFRDIERDSYALQQETQEMYEEENRLAQRNTDDTAEEV